MRELSCSECIELCPDVALGVATAEDRASVLAHVEQCRSCSDELGTLSDAADRLSVLVPPVEPPSDFVPRVVGAISRSSRAEHNSLSSRRSYVRPLSVAAAVVLAAAGGGVGWLAAEGGTGPSPAAETASFVAAHGTVGQAMTVPGKNPWISVAVHIEATATTVRCEVESSKGGWLTVGSFALHAGWGYWAAPLPRGVVVRSADLLTPGGQIVATASFAGT